MHTFRMKLQLNLYKAVMALTLFFIVFIEGILSIFSPCILIFSIISLLNAVILSELMIFASSSLTIISFTLLLSK